MTDVLPPATNHEAARAMLGRLWSGRTPAESESAFRRAARHSRRVRLLRVALPAVAVGTVALISLASFLNPLRALSSLPIDPTKLGISGTTIRMEAPRLAGYSKDNRPYELSAKSASQDLTKPTQIELNGIRAKVGLADNNSVVLDSTAGSFDANSQNLVLREGIRIAATNGYAAKLTDAHVDVRRGVIVTENPVDVTLLNGSLKANRMEIRDAGSVVTFERGVSMILMLPSADNPNLPAGRQPTAPKAPGTRP
jgi:lipopolysaccharide export system protein LptC